MPSAYSVRHPARTTSGTRFQMHNRKLKDKNTFCPKDSFGGNSTSVRTVVPPVNQIQSCLARGASV